MLSLLALLACGDEDHAHDSADPVETDADTDTDADSDTDADTDTDTDADTDSAVENTAPGMPGVIADPDPPIAGNPLSCVIETESVDAEGDEVSYTWDFFLDSEPVEDGVLADVGQAFTCRATPSDGELEGDPHTRGYVVVDPCVALDGSSWGSLPDESALDIGTDSAAQFTVEAWVWAESLDRTQSVLWKQHETGSASSSKVDWGLMVKTDGQVVWASGVSSDSCAYLVSHHGEVEAETWHHVAATLEATSPSSGHKRLFVDGELVAECDYETKNAATDGPVVLGYANGGYGWEGYLDEVHISDTLRYEGSFTPSTRATADANSLVLWHIDGIGASSLIDSSGKGRDLELDQGSTTADGDGVCD